MSSSTYAVSSGTKNKEQAPDKQKHKTYPEQDLERGKESNQE
jgi:hypothetical protein